MHRRSDTGSIIASTLLLAILTVPAPARATDVMRAKLGDHAGFSRLALSLPGGWMPMVVADPCALRVSLPQKASWPVSLLNGVWSSRISAFQVQEDSRTMIATIPCGARVTARQERKVLIVDVAGPPVPARKPTTSPIPAPALQLAEIRTSDGTPEGKTDTPTPRSAPKPAPPLPVTPSFAFTEIASALNPVGTAQAESLALIPNKPPAIPAPIPTSTPTAVPAPVPTAPVLAKVEPSNLDRDVRSSVERTLKQLEGTPAAKPSAAQPRQLELPPNAPPPIAAMDVAAWAGENFTETHAMLQGAVNDAHGRGRVDAFIALARFALARAMDEEGNAALNAAASQSPAPEQRHSLQVLGDAFRALDRNDKPDDSVFVRTPPAAPDHHVWRSVTLAPTRWATAREGLPIALKRLLGYPADLRSRLLTILAEAAGGARDANALNLIVLEMITVDSKGLADGRIDYFRGQLAELRNTPEAALGHYQKAADIRSGPFGRRAEVRSIELRRRMGTLDNDGAIAALEALRYGWRGDDIETDTLAALSNAYARNGRTDAALDIFGLLGRRFGATARGREALSAGRDLLDGVLDQLEHAQPGGLYALALQARHGRLVGLVDDRDASLRRRLATLLSRDGYTVEATRILHELTESSSGPRRAELGALLAHTLIDSGHEHEALEVLSRTGESGLDAGLAERRALLRAGALFGQGDTMRALDAVHGLTGGAVAQLRARGLFEAGEWLAARAAFAELVDPMAEPSVDDVALYSLSAYLAGDLDTVRGLAGRQGARLNGTRWAGLLETLTSPPAADRLLGADEVARQLAAADALDRLARRWRIAP